MIKIHPKDTYFVGLMRDTAKAIRTKDNALMKKVKAKFAKGDISLFYNKEPDTVRVLKKDAPPIDFPVSQWEV